MRKLQDVGKLNRMGWKATTSLRDGIARAYNTYLSTNVQPPLRAERFASPFALGLAGMDGLPSNSQKGD